MPTYVGPQTLNYVVPVGINFLDVELVGGGAQGGNSNGDSLHVHGFTGGNTTFTYDGNDYVAEGGGGGGGGKTDGGDGGRNSGGGGGATRNDSSAGLGGDGTGTGGDGGNLDVNSGDGGDGTAPNGGGGGAYSVDDASGGTGVGTGGDGGNGTGGETGAGGGGYGGVATGGDVNINGSGGRGADSLRSGVSATPGASGAADVTGLTEYGKGATGARYSFVLRWGGEGGGGGGAYLLKRNLAVTAGETITFRIGSKGGSSATVGAVRITEKSGPTQTDIAVNLAARMEASAMSPQFIKGRIREINVDMDAAMSGEVDLSVAEGAVQDIAQSLSGTMSLDLTPRLGNRYDIDVNLSGTMRGNIGHSDIFKARLRDIAMPAMSGTMSAQMDVSVGYLDANFLVPTNLQGVMTAAMTVDVMHVHPGVVQDIAVALSGTIASEISSIPAYHDIQRNLPQDLAGTMVGTMSVPVEVVTPTGVTHDIPLALQGAMVGDLSTVPARVSPHDVSVAMTGTMSSSLSVLLERREAKVTPVEAARTADYGDYRIQWSQSVRETFEFRTSLIEHDDGSEQRIAQRTTPRIRYEYTSFLSDLEMRTFMARNSSDQGRLTHIPHPRFRAYLPSDLANGMGTVAFATTPAWMTAGSHVFLKVDRHVVPGLVTAVGAPGVTFDFGTSGTVKAGSVIYAGVPVRPAVSNAISAVTSRAGTMRVNMFADPLTAYHPAYPATPPSTLDGRELFDLSPNWASVGHVGMIDTWESVDFNKGAVDRLYPHETPTRLMRFSYMLDTETVIDRIVGLFHRCRGRQRAFYMPSFINEVAHPTQTISGTAMTVPGSAFRDAYADSPVFRFLRFLHRDGSFIIGVSSVDRDGDNSRIAFATALPEVLSPGDILMISWVPRVRFETDSLAVEWRTDRAGETVLNLRTLPDEA